MKITFLGTGAGIPSKERNVTSILLDLTQEKNKLWLFDCGEATQHQILHTSIKPRKINKIFITHLHGDHIFGLPGMLSSRSFLGGTEPLTVYGPKGIKQYIETSLEISQSHLSYPIHFVELETCGNVFEENDFIVDCVLLDHNIKSLGFRIKEKDKLGELNVRKLQELGIPPGPIYSKIKQQKQTVLEDGRVIDRNDVVGEPKKGRVISIFGDTRYIPKHASFINGSNVLIHEATFDASKLDLANSYFHCTTEQTAEFAKKGNVQTLILTHISSRYQQEDKDQLLQEAKCIFPDTMLAYDFFTYEVK
ncbi:ribonuclease Z [Pseudogracilibacillus sp. SO30301A]|uniref:ribonuclease Z n=1 Tax=Pseudogracilibacillus sp. SO30301A TaxID=3098291 RepID=UPI00300E2EDB